MAQKKLKVGINGRFFVNKNTGIGRYSLNIFPEIARQYPELELIIAIPEKLDAETDKYLRYQNNMRVILVKENNLLKKLHGGLAKFLWEKISLSKFFREEEVDLIHSPYPDLSRGGETMPKIVTVHDIIPWSDENYFQRTQLSLLYNKATLEASKKADFVITVSDFSRKETLNLGCFDQDRVKTIHNACEFNDAPHFSIEEQGKILERFGLKVEDKYLFYMGGYDKRKNVQRLINIFEGMSAAMPDLKLVLGGNKVLKNSLYMDLKIPKKLENKIIFSGFLSNRELIVLYRGSVAFWSATTSEVFNLPLLEALTLGTPAIVSDLAVHREVAGELAYYFDLAWNDSRVAKEIVTLLTQEDQYNKYRQRVRHSKEELQQRFSWQNSAQQVAEIYFKVKSWN
ncbi:glycosyltransferase family 4 protein [Candidatus Peregrinibacteria bacterium]|nr:glycosyltransferase family 4 protein [Candidatus Peregrinibacteria bacterium]